MSPLSHGNAATSRGSSVDEGSSTVKQKSARSPLVTAQERKRMIMERRRRKRPLERSNSMVMGEPKSPASNNKRLLLRRTKSMPLVDSSGTKSSSQATPPSMQPRSLPQLGSPLSMTNASNSLFGHVGRRSSLARRSSLSSSSRSLVFEETPTNLGSPSSSSSQCLTPKGASLFGAVMQRTTSTPKPGDALDCMDEEVVEQTQQIPEHSITSNMSVATPVKASSLTPQRHVMWNIVSTPAQDKKSSSSSYPKKMASPGGFGLLQVLDSVMSPFKAESPASKATSPSSPKPDRFDEWHEASLDACGLTVRDWSLKRRLRMESHPGNCSPATMTGGSGDCLVEARAMQSFLGTPPSTSCKTIDDCRIQWGAGLLYWQHPAIYPSPQSNKEDNTENVPPKKLSAKAASKSGESNADAKGESKVSKTKALGEAVRGRKASIDHLVRMANPLDGNFVGNEDLARKYRQSEWQQAFRSLYFSWNQRVDQIRDEMDSKESLDQSRIREACFYTMASQHVVLFRASVNSVDNDEEMCSDSSDIIPMIVLSGATLQLRDKLESVGIKLKLLTQADKLNNGMVSNNGESKVEDEEATLVKNELEALRRAQADGVTAGADVSVSMKHKRGLRSDSQNNMVPVCLTGEQDCAAFFELYLNTCGKLLAEVSPDDVIPQDVPLLLTRRLGPFLHSSLKSLSVTSRHADADKTSKRREHQHHSTIEVRGPILPCAMEELLRSAGSRMLLDKQQLYEQKPAKRRKNHSGSGSGEGRGTGSPQENVDVGSHYFVLHLQTLEGHNGSLSGGFALLNGSDATLSEKQVVGLSLQQQEEFQECRQGEVMSMAVWDISRPNLIAYKVEPADSSLSSTVSVRRPK